MKVSVIMSVVLSIVLSLSPWLFSEYELPYKIIFSLVILVCCSIYLIVCLLIQNKKLEKAKEEITQKHRALANRFNEKRIESNARMEALRFIGSGIQIAMQSKKDDRIRILHDSFIATMLNLGRGPKN